MERFFALSRTEKALRILFAVIMAACTIAPLWYYIQTQSQPEIENRIAEIGNGGVLLLAVEVKGEHATKEKSKEYAREQLQRLLQLHIQSLDSPDIFGKFGIGRYAELKRRLVAVNDTPGNKEIKTQAAFKQTVDSLLTLFSDLHISQDRLPIGNANRIDTAVSKVSDFCTTTERFKQWMTTRMGGVHEINDGKIGEGLEELVCFKSRETYIYVVWSGAASHVNGRREALNPFCIA